MIGRPRETVPQVGNLIAVDSSARAPGLAWFANGRLMCAERVPVPGAVSELRMLERAAEVARLVVSRAIYLVGDRAIPFVAIEAPQLDGRSAPALQSVMLLAAVAGAVADRFAAMGCAIHSFTPDEWIGSISKKINGKIPADARTTARGCLISACLDRVGERAALPPGDDEVDAVGIGLKLLARLVQPTVVRKARSAAATR